MPKYLVERELPGFTEQQLRHAASRANATTAEMSREGTPIRYLRSTYLPAEQKCFCLFEAASPELVRKANERAQLPVQRITEALAVSAEDLG